MRLCIAFLFLLLSACASPIKTEWKPTQEQWEAVRATGTDLRNPDGSPLMFLSSEVINNLLTVKRRLEEQSGITTELALYETDRANAFSKVFNGKNYIALSTILIRLIATDPDALAAAMGHEMAHLKLGHSGEERQQRGLAEQGFTRDEERAADDQGMRWAAAAGYDPCGHARLVTTLGKASPTLTPAFLSSHPSYSERAVLATEYARKAGKTCDSAKP